MLWGKEIHHNIFHLEVDVYKDYFYVNSRFFPIGYFAMEALNITDESIEDLEKYSRSIQMLSLPFLQPEGKDLGLLLPQLRDNLTKLIQNLCAMPPFSSWDVDNEIRRMEKRFSEGSLENILKPGLDKAYFLRYLDDAVSVTDAIRNFRTMGRFLEECYLRDVSRRDEEHFATAARDCFKSQDFLDILYDQRLDTTTFSLSPSLRTSCSFGYDPQNEDRMIFLDTLVFDSFMDFFTYDLLSGMHHGHAPSVCQNCGRYFLTTDARRPKYCYRMATQNPHYTCRQFGAMNKQKEKNKNHPIFQIYKTRTDTTRKHHNRGKISDEIWCESKKLCEELRDRALMDTEFAQSDYIRLMRQDEIYSEVNRRLGIGETNDK